MILKGETIFMHHVLLGRRKGDKTWLQIKCDEEVGAWSQARSMAPQAPDWEYLVVKPIDLITTAPPVVTQTPVKT